MHQTLQILEGDASPTPKPAWCFWSTTESIQKEVPSVTAILETLLAVPLYWWIALRVGVIYPLLIGVAIAPLVLLRSEASVALGVKWYLGFEEKLGRVPNTFAIRHVLAIKIIISMASIMLGGFIVRLLFGISPDWNPELTIGILLIIFLLASWTLFWTLTIMAVVILPGAKYIVEKGNDSTFNQIIYIPAVSMGLLIISIGIRIAATITHLLQGILALPKNFRRVILCTSPLQTPELVPGIDNTNSEFRFHNFLSDMKYDERQSVLSFLVENVLGVLMGAILYLPAWLYRITIKSTAWFWWPLAFLGDDLKKAQNPEILRWDVMRSLWAQTSIALALASLIAFVLINVVVDGAVFEQNPLLTPLGYLLLVDWTLRPWQVCALMGSLLSIMLVFLVNGVSGKYRIALKASLKAHDTAQKAHAAGLIRTAERNFGWIERLARLRFLCVILFWCLVGAHALLYVNSTRCWFVLSPRAHNWAQDIYGDRLPPYNCSQHSGQGRHASLSGTSHD